MNPQSFSGSTASFEGLPAVPHLDVDPFAIDFFENPYPAQERLREVAPVVYLDKWNVLGVARYAEVHAVLNDPLVQHQITWWYLVLLSGLGVAGVIAGLIVFERRDLAA